MNQYSVVDIGPMRRAAWWFIERNKILRTLLRKVNKRFRTGPRRVPVRLGVDGFIKELDRLNCRYVVLRWFDVLPDVDPEGDLDVLVSDEDTHLIDRLLTRSPRRGGVKCDVYSVSGSPGFDYHRFPYFPPHVAKGILDRAILHTNGARVPSPEDHFLSFAFHSLYHKGYDAGLPIDEFTGPVASSSRRDYAKTLSDLAAEIGLTSQITMKALDEELEGRGWKPSPDMLMKWAVRNDWCRALVDDAFKDSPIIEGLTVGLVREAAADPESIEFIVEEFARWGFRVVVARHLDDKESHRASRLIRGGNWGRGAWPRSGGQPAGLIVAVDPSPSAASKELERRHPGVDNARVFDLKKHLRDIWNEKRPLGERTNIMHSSDNAHHALHYLQLIAPDDAEEIVRLIGQLSTETNASPDHPPQK